MTEPGRTADAIVVAYRSADVVESCVTSLLQQGPVSTVTVVNNSAGDAVSEMFRDESRVEVIDAPANLGYGNAINRARASCSRPYVVISNPDLTVGSGTVAACIAFLERHPRAGVVGPRVVDEDGNLSLTSQHDASLFQLIVTSLGGPAGLGVPRSARQHARTHRAEYLIGAFMVCRREALEEVGWFDPSIFLFGEDQDLSRRLVRADWEVWYVPVGEVVHIDAHSSSQVPGLTERHLRLARFEQLHRSGRPIQARLYRFIMRILGRWR